MTHDAHAERLADFAAGVLDAEQSERVLAHVEGCEQCSRELDFLADVVAATAGQGSVVPAAPRRSPLRMLPVWISGLAAAAVLLLFLVPRDSQPVARWSDLADRSRPAYVATTARTAAPERALDDALAAYARGDAHAALDGLSAHLERHPTDAQAAFFRGMTQVELGDLEGAQRDLEQAFAHGGGYLREHARWRLAQLALLREDPATARALLAEIVAEDGEFAALARAQLERIAGR